MQTSNNRVFDATLVIVVCLLFAAGCVHVEFAPYVGTQDWPTGSAFVRDMDGIEVFEGLPTKPYEVIGIVDVSSGEPFTAKEEILKLAQVHGADAMIWLRARQTIK